MASNSLGNIIMVSGIDIFDPYGYTIVNDEIHSHIKIFNGIIYVDNLSNAYEHYTIPLGTIPSSTIEDNVVFQLCNMSGSDNLKWCNEWKDTEYKVRIETSISVSPMDNLVNIDHRRIAVIITAVLPPHQYKLMESTFLENKLYDNIEHSIEF